MYFHNIDMYKWATGVKIINMKNINNWGGEACAAGMCRDI